MSPLELLKEKVEDFSEYLPLYVLKRDPKALALFYGSFPHPPRFTDDVREAYKPYFDALFSCSDDEKEAEDFVFKVYLEAFTRSPAPTYFLQNVLHYRPQFSERSEFQSALWDAFMKKFRLFFPERKVKLNPHLKEFLAFAYSARDLLNVYRLLEEFPYECHFDPSFWGNLTVTYDHGLFSYVWDAYNVDLFKFKNQCQELSFPGRSGNQDYFRDGFATMPFRELVSYCSRPKDLYFPCDLAKFDQFNSSATKTLYQVYRGMWLTYLLHQRFGVRNNLQENAPRSTKGLSMLARLLMTLPQESSKVFFKRLFRTALNPNMLTKLFLLPEQCQCSFGHNLSLMNGREEKPVYGECVREKNGRTCKNRASP